MSGPGIYLGASRAKLLEIVSRSQTVLHDVQTSMWLACLAIAALVVRAAPLVAAPQPSPAQATRSQQPASEPQKEDTSEKKPSEAKSDGTAQREDLQLPVSVDKIRDALAQPPGAPLKGLDNPPTFRIVIEERQKFDDLIATLKFESGPTIPGGRYSYDLQRQMNPDPNNPRMQPYGAFTQGELVQVLVTSYLQRLFAGRLMSAVTNAERSRAEEAAHAEVDRAIAAYCAAQPNGAGIRICESK